MVEIRCPESCGYLVQSRQTEMTKVVKLQVANLNPKSLRSLYSDERRLWVIGIVEQTVADVQRSELTDLIDTEIIDALNNIVKNLETAASGLIYEHQASSPRAQALSSKIRENIEKSLKDPAFEQRPTSTDILETLKLERSIAELMARDKPDGSGFLRHILLITPWPQETERKIIL